MKKIIDFRSDTVTKPTELMRKAMYEAEVGDDVYGEDYTVNKLEELSAAIVGKEAAMFVPSGTMANQIAMMCFADRATEVLLEADAHIFFYENGALSLLTGAQTRTIKADKGILTKELIKKALRPNDDIHQPITSVVCVENTHNRGGGVCYKIADLSSLHEFTKLNKIPLYMDGARLFNAAAALSVDAHSICCHVDALMFCLSKGLCSPVGSILAGSADFIEKARRYRKLLGGGMRQAGILAAAGIISLEMMRSRLADDHKAAKRIAGVLWEKGYDIELSSVETNIVIFDVASKKYNSQTFIKKLEEYGILASSFGETKVRFVTHNDISSNDVEELCRVLTKEF